MDLQEETHEAQFNMGMIMSASTYLKGKKALVDLGTLHSGDAVGTACIGTTLIARQIDERELAKQFVGAPAFEDQLQQQRITSVKTLNPTVSKNKRIS